MIYWQWTHGNVNLLCLSKTKKKRGFEGTIQKIRFAGTNRFTYELSKKIIFISFKIRDELTKNTGSHGTTNKDFSRITCKEPRFPVICIRLYLWMKRKIFKRKIFFGQIVVLLQGVCPKILTELPRFVLYCPIMGWCQVKLCVDFNIFSFFAKSN